MQLMRACFLGCLLLHALPASRAHACSMPAPGLYAMNLVPGIPDAQGNLNGQPNPNVVPEGSDLLLAADCDDCTNVTLTTTLTDATNQTRTATLERIKPGTFWRLHPQQPLAAGKYTLKTQYAGPNMSPTSDVISYVFKVQGTPSTTPLDFEIGLASDLATLGVNAGTTFTCDEIDSCGRHNMAWTQWLPRVDIAATHTGQVSPPQMQAFLYRLLASDDPKAADSTLWGIDNGTGLELRVTSMEQKPEYCVELQALHLTDLTITSLTKRCVNYTLPTSPPDPVPFTKSCSLPAPEKYVRAWCEDNQAACSASNPNAARDQVKSACAVYPTLCAPFLGNRTGDRVCQ